MPISLVSQEVTVSYALALCCARLPTVISPEGLFREAVQFFDSRNAKFADANELAMAVGAYVSDHATHVKIDLAQFEGVNEVFAQFKRVLIGRVGPMNVAVLQAKKDQSAGLAAEARMLQTLKTAGLRTVPVYNSPEEIESTGQMTQKAVIGNFLDCKEGFTEKQNVNLVAALLSVKGANKEADLIQPIKEAVSNKIALKQYPKNILACIDQALLDFKKIQAYLNENFISDLQGILEFGTGRFYIIDPLKLGPMSEAIPMEKACVAYVNQSIATLESLKEVMKKEMTKK